MSQKTTEKKNEPKIESEEEEEYDDDVITPDIINYIFNDTKRMKHHTLGTCPFPTGRVLTADPLCYLQSSENILFKSKKIKPGTYPIELSIVHSKMFGVRIAGSRLKISQKAADSYEKAICEKKGKETDFSGFPVDAGMACFCDEASVKSYWQFLDKWYKENKNGNIYNNYFADLFAQSYKECPELQREGGDFLLWKNPLDESLIPMFASGFGDGYYEDFWGIDENGELCELVTIFFDPHQFE